jgi:hypothetical protein
MLRGYPCVAQTQINWLTEKTREASAFYLFKGGSSRENFREWRLVIL